VRRRLYRRWMVDLAVTFGLFLTLLLPRSAVSAIAAAVLAAVVLSLFVFQCFVVWRAGQHRRAARCAGPRGRTRPGATISGGSPPARSLGPAFDLQSHHTRRSR
jgi:hypothetical protein